MLVHTIRFKSWHHGILLLEHCVHTWGILDHWLMPHHFFVNRHQQQWHRMHSGSVHDSLLETKPHKNVEFEICWNLPLKACCVHFSTKSWVTCPLMALKPCCALLVSTVLATVVAQLAQFCYGIECADLTGWLPLRCLIDNHAQLIG